MGPDFKLTIYFTAPSEGEAIGIELLRKVQALTDKSKVFELKLRLGDSKEKQDRWNDAFIEKTLVS